MLSSYRALHWEHSVAPEITCWNPPHCVKQPHDPPKTRMTAGDLSCHQRNLLLHASVLLKGVMPTVNNNRNAFPLGVVPFSNTRKKYKCLKYYRLL